MFVFINLMAQSFVWSQSEETITKKVDCYDRYGNKIDGLECNELIQGIQFNMKVFFSVIILLVSILMLIIILQESIGGYF